LFYYRFSLSERIVKSFFLVQQQQPHAFVYRIPSCAKCMSVKRRTTKIAIIKNPSFQLHHNFHRNKKFAAIKFPTFACACGAQSETSSEGNLIASTSGGKSLVSR